MQWLPKGNDGDPEQRDDTFDRNKDGFFIVRWLSLHTFQLLYRSWKKPLELSDLMNLNEDMQAESAYEQYRLKERQNGNFYENLWSVISHFILTGICLTCCSAFMGLTGPIAVKKIVRYLVKQNNSSDLYHYLLVFAGIAFLRVFLNQYAQRMFIHASIRMEQLLSMLLYDKITKLSITYRLNMKKGGLFAYWTNNVRAISSFILTGSNLFAGPAGIFGVVLFILYEFHFIGAAFAICVIIGLTIILILTYFMFQCHWRKSFFHSLRIACNMQMLSNIKDLKLLGWQQLFINKNVNCREEESKEMKRLYTIANIWDTIINLAPMFIMLFVIKFQKKFEPQAKFGLPQIYYLISYVSLSYLPSRLFLSALVRGSVAIRALREVKTFLEVEQLQIEPTKNLKLLPGQVIIRNLFATSNDTAQEQARNDKKSLSSVRQAYIDVPMEIRLKKGDRIILLSDERGGKSSFIRAVAGQLKIKRGATGYNGKIGIVTQKMWFRKKSIKDNVLFGQPFNRAKLDRVYKEVGLKNLFTNLPKGQMTIIEQNCNWSSAKKLKIALARCLYYQPDIVFLDEPFATLDPETCRVLYGTICKIWKDSTLIITSQLTSFINADDKVYLLSQGTVLQYGLYSTMLMNYNSSYIHRMMFQEDDGRMAVAETDNEKKEAMERLEKKAERQRKVRVFLKALLSLSRDQSQQSISLLMKRASGVYQEKIESSATKRQPAVQFKFYKNFLEKTPLLLIVFIVVLILIGTISKALSDWWLGMAGRNSHKFTQNDAIIPYVIATVVCGFAIGFAGYLGTFISRSATREIAVSLTKSIAQSSPAFLEEQNPFKNVNRCSRDTEEFFTMTNLMMSILRNIVLFIVSVALIASRAPVFFILITLTIVVVNFFIFSVFINADRQLFSFRSPMVEQLSKQYEEAINGIDLFRSYNKMEVLYKDFTKLLYKLNVHSINYRYLSQSMFILTQISGNIVVCFAAYFILYLRQSQQVESVVSKATAIAFAMKISLVFTTLIRDSTRLDNLMKLVVKNAYEVIGKNAQELYNEPLPPEDWPVNNEVELRNVSLKPNTMKKVLINNMSLKIGSGQKVALCGRGGSGKGTLLNSLARILLPVPGSDGKTGVILFGGVDTKTIGRKYYSEKVMTLTSYPVIFTGSIRQNVDPFDEYSNLEVQKALQDVELWKSIEVEEEEPEAKLAYELSDGGVQLSQNQMQRLSIARAILRKPNLLILDNSTSNLDMRLKQRLMERLYNRLANSTIVMIPEGAKFATQCDKVIYMERGAIKQFGDPQELMHRGAAFNKLVKSGTKLFPIYTNRELVSQQNME